MKLPKTKEVLDHFIEHFVEGLGFGAAVLTLTFLALYCGQKFWW